MDTSVYISILKKANELSSRGQYVWARRCQEFGLDEEQAKLVMRRMEREGLVILKQLNHSGVGMLIHEITTEGHLLLADATAESA
ncbi:MAG: hypothetical protein JSS51_04245 [Planctomycetes bacterium]|nr:hypothetical protein [Planctomycetota bacterium]